MAAHAGRTEGRFALLLTDQQGGVTLKLANGATPTVTCPAGAKTSGPGVETHSPEPVFAALGVE